MMKSHVKSILGISLILTAVMLIFPVMGAVADEGVCNITDLVVIESGRIEVAGDRELDYRFFPLSNPERLVFDFKNSRLLYNDGYLAEIKPSSDIVFAVRISQFSLDPDIVRLVVEPSGSELARISRSDGGIKLVIDFGEVISDVRRKEPVEVIEEDEPVVDDPVIDDPVIDDPVIDEPAVDDPVIEAEPVEIVEIIEPVEEVLDSEPVEVIETETVPQSPPVQAAKPKPLPFKVMKVDDGLAVDVRGIPRDMVQVRKKFRPRQIVIETGKISGKAVSQTLGKINMASGPVSSYETFGYEDDNYRLILSVNANTEYREETLPDGVRIVISEKKKNPIRVLSSSDETEVAEGTFTFEIGEPVENAVEGLEGLGGTVETMLEEIGEDTDNIIIKRSFPSDRQPVFMPLAPINIPAQTVGRTGADYQLKVGDMVVMNTFGLERVSVGNPEVITVNVISQEEILITAKGEGQSALMTWESNGYKQIKWIEVAANVELQTGILTDLIGEKDIIVNIVGETVIIEGTVDTDLERARAVAIATSFGTAVVDLIEVLAPKQVMVKIRMVEIDKKAIDEYFKQVSAGARADNGDFTFSIISAILDPEIPGGGLINAGIRPGIVNGNINDIRYDPIDIALDYLETERKANILSEPNLLALHGSEAKFRVGGEIPYTYQNEQGVNVVEFKEFGVELNMLPLVNSNNSIRLHLNPIVRTIDYSLAIAGIPGFRTREMTTDVQLKSGQTMVLGGLIQSEITSSVAKIPILGDIPILGELFRSKKFQEDVTELLIFITPIVINDDSDLKEFVTEGMDPDDRIALFEKNED